MPWFRLAVGIFVAAQAMMLGTTVNLTPPEAPLTHLLLNLGMLAATLVVLGLLGLPLMLEAGRALLERRVTMELLFLVGVAASFTLSCHATFAPGAGGGVYYDVVCVLLVIYSVGHAINARSRERALSAIDAFTTALATARRDGGAVVPVATVAIGDEVEVRPGELIPVDGVIARGASLVRQAAFTGEWTSSHLRPGDAVLAGTFAEDGLLAVRATAPGADRRVDRLAALIASARTSPTGLQRQADRFVRWFLPIVLTVAAGVLVFWTRRTDLSTGILRALAVLLVACPCAAGLATPLAIWSVLGHLARRGLVLHTGDAIERLASIDSVLFDKTGTLADERLALQSLETPGDEFERAATLAVIRAVEARSDHPVARLLRDVPAPADAPEVKVLSLNVLPGRGVEARVQVSGADHTVTITRTSPAPRAEEASSRACEGSPGQGGATRHRDPSQAQDDDVPTLRIDVHIDERLCAVALIAESLRPTTAAAIADLRALGLPLHVFTGDAPAGASAVARLAPTTASLTPEEKHARVLALRNGAGSDFRRPLFVGDGLNDAAAMAAAHVSIALASGAQIAVETASATLHGQDLTLVPDAIHLARRAVAAIRSNLRWAVFYNVLGICAAAAGWLHPIAAAVLMAVSSAVVAHRSFRLTAPVEEDDQPSPSPLYAGERAGVRGRASQGVADANHRSAEADPPETAHPQTRHPEPARDLRVNEADADTEIPRRLGMTPFADDGRSAPAALSPRTARPLDLLHAASLVGQAALLIPLAELPALPAILLLLVAALLAPFALSKIKNQKSDLLQMLFPMLTLGGLGMALGWWADSGFASAVGHACCRARAPLDPLPRSWMDFGMLALGLPAMYLLRYRSTPFSLRRWCCVAPLVFGTPGMIVGMRLAMHFGPRIADASAQVLLDHVVMVLGMSVGMVIPHLLDPLFSRPAVAGISSAR